MQFSLRSILIGTALVAVLVATPVSLHFLVWSGIWSVVPAALVTIVWPLAERQRIFARGMLTTFGVALGSPDGLPRGFFSSIWVIVFMVLGGALSLWVAARFPAGPLPPPINSR